MQIFVCYHSVVKSDDACLVIYQNHDICARSSQSEIMIASPTNVVLGSGNVNLRPGGVGLCSTTTPHVDRIEHTVQRPRYPALLIPDQ